MNNAAAGRVRSTVVAATVASLLTMPGIGQVKAAEATIVIENMRFTPAVLQAHSGDRITWQNRDLVPHTATAAGTFDSKVIEPGKSWSYVIGPAGRVEYVCKLHPSMTGALVIK